MTINQYITVLKDMKESGAAIDNLLYKICPKCNENHSENCKHCAWAGTSLGGCDIGVRIYFDGSYNKLPLQIIPYKLSEYALPNIIKYWNIMYFATKEEAEKALDEYDTIRSIKNKTQRFSEYVWWVDQRQVY